MNSMKTYPPTVESNFYCVKCNRDISSDEECAKKHTGKKSICGGKVQYRTYQVQTTKKLVMIDNKCVPCPDRL